MGRGPLNQVGSWVEVLDPVPVVYKRLCNSGQGP